MTTQAPQPDPTPAPGTVVPPATEQPPAAPITAPIPPADPAALAAAQAAAAGQVTPQERPPEPDNAQWRDYTKGVETERDDYRGQLVDIRIQQIGLDPSTGLGVAVKDTYKGPTDLQSIATFAAQKYGHVLNPTAQPTPAGQVAAAQAPAQTLAAMSQPVTPESPAQRAAAQDAKLASPDATRQDAVNSLVDNANMVRQSMIPG